MFFFWYRIQLENCDLFLESQNMYVKCALQGQSASKIDDIYYILCVDTCHTWYRMPHIICVSRPLECHTRKAITASVGRLKYECLCVYVWAYRLCLPQMAEACACVCLVSLTVWLNPSQSVHAKQEYMSPGIIRTHIWPVSYFGQFSIFRGRQGSTQKREESESESCRYGMRCEEVIRGEDDQKITNILNNNFPMKKLNGATIV